MAGKIITNWVALGDHATDSNNFVLKTNVDGTATFARGVAGNLGTVFGVNGSGAITGASLVSPTITGATITVAATAAPAFSATNNATQTLSSAVYTKIAFQTEEFDTNSNFDNTTNYRFTPTAAGYYQVNGRVLKTSTAADMLVVIYKNGSAFKGGAEPSTSYSCSVSALVYMNGSTDYIELYGYILGGGIIPVSASDVYFQASMVRSA
jgi:hypothetical protein